MILPPLPSDPSNPSLANTNTIPTVVVTKHTPEPADPSPGTGLVLGEEEIELSAALEREICMTINRELHVSYCYFTMGGEYTR